MSDSKLWRNPEVKKWPHHLPYEGYVNGHSRRASASGEKELPRRAETFLVKISETDSTVRDPKRKQLVLKVPTANGEFYVSWVGPQWCHNLSQWLTRTIKPDACVGTDGTGGIVLTASSIFEEDAKEAAWQGSIELQHAMKEDEGDECVCGVESSTAIYPEIIG